METNLATMTDATGARHEVLSNATDTELIECDRKVKRRLDNRQRLRDSRLRERDELQRLREQVADLAQLHLTKSKPLPWKEVCTALSEETRLSQTRHRDLARRVERMRQLVQQLVTWSPPMDRSSWTSLLPHQSDWRHHALLGSAGDARHMSYQWLTDRLYHNTDAALGLCAEGSSVVAIDSTGDDDLAYVVFRSHRIVRGTLCQATRAQRRIYIDSNPEDAILDREFLEQSFGDDIVHITSGVDDPPAVVRVFQGSQRSVLVATHITHDAARSVRMASNGNTTQGWIVLDEVTPTLTRVREFWLMGFPAPSSVQAYASALGHATVDDVATMEPSARFDAYMHQMQSNFNERSVHCADLLTTTLHEIVQVDQSRTFHA